MANSALRTPIPSTRSRFPKRHVIVHPRNHIQRNHCTNIVTVTFIDLSPQRNLCRLFEYQCPTLSSSATVSTWLDCSRWMSDFCVRSREFIKACFCLKTHRFLPLFVLGNRSKTLLLPIIGKCTDLPTASRLRSEVIYPKTCKIPLPQHTYSLRQHCTLNVRLLLFNVRFFMPMFSF